MFKRENGWTSVTREKNVFMKIPSLCFLKCWGMSVLKKKYYAVMVCLKSKRMYQPNFSKGDVV